MSQKSVRLIASLFLLVILSLSLAHADTVEKNGVSVSLTSPQATYTATDSIPVNLKVNNNCGFPISNVVLQILSVDGYCWSDDSAPNFTQPLLLHGQDISTSAVHVLQAGLPPTGDNTPIAVYLFLVLASVGGLVWLGRTHPSSRRVMSIVLCLTFFGTALLPQITAQADERISLDPNSWPTKMNSVLRSSVSSNTQTVEVTQTVSVDDEVVILRARVTFTLPSSSDNLNDDRVDLGDLELLESQGIIDVLYDENGQPAFVDGPFTSEKVTTCEDAADVLNSAESLFGNGFYAEPEDIVQQHFTDIYGTTENFFRYTPTIDGVEVFGSQIVLAASKDGSITSLTNSYDNEILNVDTTPTLTQDEAETKAKEAFLQEASVQSLLNWMKQQDSTATDASVQADFLAWMQTETELLIYAANDDLNPALVYAVTITNAPTEGEVTDDSEDAVILPHYELTYYIYANRSHAGQVCNVIDGMMLWSSKTISWKDNQGVERVINVEEKDGVYRLHDTVRNIETRKVKVNIEKKHDNYGNIARVGHIELPGNYVESSHWVMGTLLDRKAVSLHANMRDVYRFYMNVLNRQSFDGNGAAIVSSMNYWFPYPSKDIGEGWSYNTNAGYSFALNQFAFGNGDNYQDCLDMVAHEFTHGVTNYVNDLIYEHTESGALNEAYSDIMGNLIENKTDSGRWQIAENLTDGPSRDMSDPSDHDQPEHYRQYIEGGDPHDNSGIISFAAYKMMTDRRTSSVSGEQWARIFYDSMYRLTADADFMRMRGAVLCSAAKYGYGKENAVHDAIKAAFDAVGVKEAQPLRIVLTWGSEPEDLDAHLTGPSAANGDERFHIYYGAQVYTANEGYYGPDGGYFDPEVDSEYPSDILIADLDYDDTTSWGPEIITIHTLIPGDYYFFVHDYSNGGDSESRALAQSGATVTITLPSGQRMYYSVESTSEGTIWDVCRIHVTADGFVTVNRLDVYGNETTCR